MSVKGVSDSPLLGKSILGDQSRVPIGAPVITNLRVKNSKEIQALMTGQTLTEPQLNQFETFGQDGREAFRKESNSIDYRDRTLENGRLIEEWSYDPQTGSLVLVRKNQEEYRIFNFLRQDAMGRGATGPRGDPGKDGKNGRLGRDGAQGATGCEGEKGDPGETGNPGVEGNPGIMGLQGPDGCEGASGDRGVMGPQGRNGFEGARGLTGPSCDEENTGAQGAQGAKFGKGVAFGLAAASDPEVAIMGLDDDGVDAVAPTCGWTGKLCGATTAPATPAPDTSAPANPAPPPTASARISLCTSFGNQSPKSSCGGTSTAWYVAWANFDAGGGVLGLSGLPLARQNTAWWPNSVVMCGTLAAGAAYTFELITPPGVASTLFLNCAIISQTDYPGGTTRVTKTLDKPTEVRLRFLNNAARIPTWCALKIYNASTGELLYFTGKNAKNAGLKGEFASSKTDDNWAGNSSVQQYL